MSEPAIRAALEAACATDYFWRMCDPDADRDIMRDRAAAIAAFLRAKGQQHEARGEVLAAGRYEWLAAAVEEAARDG